MDLLGKVMILAHGDAKEENPAESYLQTSMICFIHTQLKMNKRQCSCLFLSSSVGQFT